jgi:hypothetical protein
MILALGRSGLGLQADGSSGSSGKAPQRMSASKRPGGIEQRAQELTDAASERDDHQRRNRPVPRDARHQQCPAGGAGDPCGPGS